MKVDKTYVSFTGKINVGHYACFIKLDDFGADIKLDDLIQKIIHFNKVVIEGYEPFKQREEISKLIKKAEKFNPNITFEFFTNGTIKPTGISNLDNITFNVNLQLKNSGMQYKDRIKSNTINWFNEVDSNFIFFVKNSDDLDEVTLLVQEFGIKKSKVFLFIGEEVSKQKLKILIKFCKRTKYNFTLDYKKLFWEEEEK